jgi:hypothetical protein
MIETRGRGDDTRIEKGGEEENREEDNGGERRRGEGWRKD